ncbi:hypothetical protein P691DRAFT_813357 [Macrolepiota fuliginosa MF-IS2]|uniref:F-box domain-containing protein n=1 Tax=Macrolepiota fuliginosa MF-IS2 TaxID=1400762 RepID=A0A9P6C570_9AGAR|nr:hypothetical protein P691DRAFT_813357 [Macrolepiota fuliginosa MF-IS2]
MIFTDLPPEILLKVITLLELGDVARIRQSCKQLRDITQDKFIWVSLLKNQRWNHPIPPWFDFYESLAAPANPSTVELEHAVVTTHRIARAWPCPRSPPLKAHPRLGDMLFMLEMYLDRWLLVIYAEGLVYLWDTQANPMTPPGRLGTTSRARICAKLMDEDKDRQGRWTSCAAQVTEDGQKLVVLLNLKAPPALCRVYEVALKPDASFKLLMTVRLSTPEIIRSISFSDNMLILSRGSAINLVDIAKKPRRDLLVLSPYSEDLEDMWNGTIEIRVFNRYLFAFKARSIEVHDMDHLLETTHREFTAIPFAKHFFHNMTFRDVRISTPIISFDPCLEIKFQVFSYDVLQGLFDFGICLQIRPEDPPVFTVALLNIYALANHVASQFSRILTGPDLLTPSPTPTNEMRSPFRQTNLSSRGFLSAYALGPRAKRAVWVERIRGSTLREIQVWNDSSTPEDEQIVDGPPGEIERVAVYTISSPDLREDVIRCALSESMGLIVLGNRAGEIFLLDLDA